ncbi:MAG: rhomboid family intramembrane serine protease, partial [Actinobacteria bacterium]|nr:rhomboid family intramembrane serine protease [Actinomycetota bacterium]
MTAPVCVRHPGRETSVRCTRCDRPACPTCLREASVGYQCVDCVAQGARSQRRATTVAGAESPGRSVVVPGLIAINIVIFMFTVVQARSLG